MFDSVKVEQLNDAKYEGSILGLAKRNYQGRVKGFTVFNPDKKDMPNSYKLNDAVGVLKKHMGNRADEVDASLGLPDVYGDSGYNNQQNAIKRASRNPNPWFSTVVRNLKNSDSDTYGTASVEGYSIKDDDVEYSGDAISFINDSGAKLFFTRGSVAGRVEEPIQGRLRPKHTPSPYSQRKATRIRVGTSSSEGDSGVPLSLFSTFKKAGIEEKEAKQTVQTLEDDFGDVWSSEDDKDNERIRQKYFASAKKKRRQ